MPKYAGQYNGLPTSVESAPSSGLPGTPGPAGKDGKDGKDGFSPTINTREIEGGHELIITDVNGTKTVDVMNGQEGPVGPQGKQGIQGDPGYSPKVSVDTIENGHQVKITDVDGSKTFEVMNGKDGLEGERGPEGKTGEPGQDGQDGFSPIVDISEVDGGHKVIITDRNGPHEFIVRDGKTTVVDDETKATVVNVPIGSIIPWAGEAASIPEGWHICNGEDGTLDLRDKFIVGAGNEYEVESTGGEKEVTLTYGQMPKHAHQIPLYDSESKATSALMTRIDVSGKILESKITLSPYLNATTEGSSQPHNNLPPYIALFYIQKIGETPTDYVDESRVQELLKDAKVDIGTVTATVDDNTGVPEVIVEQTDSGVDFQFKNLKGETGPKGEPGGPAVQIDGLYGFNVTDEGRFQMGYTGTEPPPFFLEDGHLKVNLPNTIDLGSIIGPPGPEGPAGESGITVEEYDENDWHIRKYSDGYCELFRTAVINGWALSKAYGNLYGLNSGYGGGSTFPFSLKEKYIDHTMVYSYDNTIPIFCGGFIRNNSKLTGSEDVSVLSPVSTTSAKVQINTFVAGRWK